MRNIAWLPFILLLSASSCSPGRAPSEADNLVLIVIDTLRRDHVSVYGYERETTPELDGIARSGARLDGFAPSSWTKPVVASILTGLHPVRHQTISESDALPTEVVTLAQRLRSRGFRTQAVVSNAWISRAWGFDRGFESFIPVWNVRHERFPSSAAVNSELIPRLNQLTPPFFLFVHYLDPHQPYDPESAWDGSPLPTPLRAASPMRLDEPPVDATGRGASKIRDALDLYDGEIRETDRALGELVRALKTKGLLDRTLIVVTSDHGEEFAEHGNVAHGRSLYSEVVEVPLVFALPGVIPGNTHLGGASLISIVPTALDLLGVRTGESDQRPFDGESIAADLRAGRSASQRKEPMLFHLDLDSWSCLALQTDSRKLILSKAPRWKGLYDLERDPGEIENLLSERFQARSARQMVEHLTIEFNGLARAAVPRLTTSADEDLTTHIAALGYLKAFKGTGSRRNFPRRLGPADRFQDGLGGWEETASFRACARVEEMPAAQFTRGFFAPELGGRWTQPEATLVLPHGSSGETRLNLSGVNHRPDSVDLGVSMDGGPFVDLRIPVGRYSLQLPLPPLEPDAATLLVRLRADTSFIPTSIGMADERELGVFLTEVCVN